MTASSPPKLSRRDLLYGSAALTACAGGTKLAVSEPPEQAGSVAVALPRYHHQTLEDGTELYLAPRPGSRIVSAALVLDAGSVRDPPSLHGLSRSLAALLGEGTATLDGRGLAEAFGSFGGELGVSSEERALTMYARVLPTSAANAIELMAELAVRPSLPIATLTEERVRMLRIGRRSAEDLARAACITALAGTVRGTSFFRDLRVPTPEQLREAVDAMARRRRAVVLAGAVDPDTTPHWVAAATSQLPPVTDAKLPEISPKPPAQTREVIVVDRPGDEAVLCFGYPGPQIGDLDRDARELAAVFAEARLHWELRGRRRDVYGLLETRVDTAAGPLELLHARVDPARIDSILAGTVKVLDSLADTVVSDAWTRHVTTGWIVSEMNNLQSTDGLALAAAGLFVSRLPPDYYPSHLHTLENVDGEKVRRALQDHFNRHTTQIVLVGPAAELVPAAERVQSMPVVVRDPAELD